MRAAGREELTAHGPMSFVDELHLVNLDSLPHFLDGGHLSQHHDWHIHHHVNAHKKGTSTDFGHEW